MFINLKDILVKSLNKTWKQESVINSIIWNTLISTFKDKKNIDITPYLISIKMHNDTIFIKTSKPIINSEIDLIWDVLIENIIKKLHDIWYNFKQLKIRYK